MKQIKKIILSSMIITGISSSAFALDTYKNISFGASQTNVNSENSTVLKLSGEYGVYLGEKKNYFASGELGVEYGKYDDTYIFGYTPTVHAGYYITPEFAVGVLGSYKSLKIGKDGGTTKGFGYGGTISYALSSNLIAELKYEKYDLTRNGNEDIEYDNLGTNLKFRF